MRKLCNRQEQKMIEIEQNGENNRIGDHYLPKHSGFFPRWSMEIDHCLVMNECLMNVYGSGDEKIHTQGLKDYF